MDLLAIHYQNTKIIIYTDLNEEFHENKFIFKELAKR
jgi:hypothetical protein